MELQGFTDGHAVMSDKTARALQRWSGSGALPVLIDATSCTHGVLSDLADASVEVLDSIAWVHDHLLPRLSIPRRLATVAIHPTCASQHLGLSGKLAAVGAQMADEVIAPAASSCCGMAGDRGLLRPELPASALRDLAQELEGRSIDACVSSNRTCEVALHQVTGRNYSSFVLALEELTRE